jgi:hypothetical protein
MSMNGRRSAASTGGSSALRTAISAATTKRGAGAFEPDAGHQRGRDPDRGRADDPGDHQPQRPQPRRSRLPA